MSSTLGPLEYASQVYNKVDVLSPPKQLLFEVGLCEILVVLVADLAADEDTSTLAAYQNALDAIRVIDQKGTPQSKRLVKMARQTVEALIPDDDDARAWRWTTALWQNAGISIYYTCGVVLGDQQSGFPLTHYIEAMDHIIQVTSSLNTPLPLSLIQLPPIMLHAHHMITDMIQTLESLVLSPDAVAEYYKQVDDGGHSLASMAKQLRDEARNRGVKI
ncbi:hypothetical protein EX895_002989 [Sporisorium graminicola]|uniref:Uncharacterized protein n=1 Tax=Sporisorium graminicola TaxID=280036 RepID=A0A4U7KTT1_9BASI|nr:hypothetical protein EX895_002989 [Sporisorium graminicola]TKY87893.1 hypothetical protein EX895_002989 [Sporisorium graminicola]